MKKLESAMNSMPLALAAFAVLVAFACVLLHFHEFGRAVLCVLLSAIPLGWLIGLAITYEEPPRKTPK